MMTGLARKAYVLLVDAVALAILAVLNVADERVWKDKA